MSKPIEDACLAVAKTNLWRNKPIDASRITDYHAQICGIAYRALEIYSSQGLSEKDIANAVWFIDSVYALPPIEDDAVWFKDTLDTLLALTVPFALVSGDARCFAKKLISGIENTMKN